MPQKEKTSIFFHELMKNVLAGLTVSFVALSLGAAFGVMSGRGAFIGMLSAGIIAFIAALLGGTRVKCAGPTGPMTVVIAMVVMFSQGELLTQFPGVNSDHFVNMVLFVTAILVGLMAIFKAGKYISLIPNVVTSGFMNGIAFIIFIDQAKAIINAYNNDYQNFSIFMLFILATLFFVFFVPKLMQKYMSKLAGVLSGTLLALVVLTIVAEIFEVKLPRTPLGDGTFHFSDLGGLISSQFPVISTFSWTMAPLIVGFSAQLALLLYLDTMLTSVVIDKMRGEKTNRSKELAAQGLGTAAVAAVGGIPGSQATIRSVLVIKEGATWRLAGVLVGVFALIELFLFQGWVSLIPQAVFIGILIKVGFDVLDTKPVRLYLKELSDEKSNVLNDFFSRHDDEPIFVTNREMLIIIGTTVLTLFTNLIVAVIAFTAIFYIGNFFIWKKNPIRDLKPPSETDAFMNED